MSQALTPQRLARIEARIREERELRFATNTVDTLPDERSEQQRVTPEVIQEARRRVAAGESKATVSRALGFRPMTLGRYLRDLETSGRHERKSDPAVYERIRKLVADGESHAEVARIVGCHVNTVRNALRYHQTEGA